MMLKFIVIKFSTIIFCLIMHFEYISCYVSCYFYAIYVNVLSYTHLCDGKFYGEVPQLTFSVKLPYIQ